jgi:hypothetical protein
MEYQLIIPRIPQNRELSAVEQVLLNRGIMPENVEHYLNTSDSDILNPSLIMNMKQGAQMLITHIAQNDKVLI